jgi:hypothetical protein
MFLIGGFGPLVLFGSVLWYRDASTLIRRLYLALAIVGIAWAMLGIIRLYHFVHFTHEAWMIAQRVQTLLAGIALGLLLASVLSGDFWKVARHYRYWYGLTHRSRSPI